MKITSTASEELLKAERKLKEKTVKPTGVTSSKLMELFTLSKVKS